MPEIVVSVAKNGGKNASRLYIKKILGVLVGVFAIVLRK